MASAGRLQSGEPASPVQVAQALLWQLRERHGIRPEGRGELPWADEAAPGEGSPAGPDWSLRNAQQELRRRRRDLCGSPGYPSHSQETPTPSQTSPRPGPRPLADLTAGWVAATRDRGAIPREGGAAAVVAEIAPAREVKVYPDIALGMLREERVAAGRVWLLLRALDAPGRGMMSLDDARAALTGAGSPLRLCGWRRLRQLLAEGDGVFWARERDRATGADRLRLFGPARVAAALGVTRLSNRPVAVPVGALRGSIGDARAHLYATFHSGRNKGITNYELGITNEGDALNSSALEDKRSVTRHSSLGSPIARDTLTALSGVCARSQVTYERRAGVRSRSNIALGERIAARGSDPVEQERAWQYGRALFRLKDYRGRHGRPGATYLARRLPNAYGCGHDHRTRPKGQQKRINRRLADLFTKGMTGTDEAIEKRFFASGTTAWRAVERGRCSGGQAHWPLRGRVGASCGLWATAEHLPAT